MVVGSFIELGIALCGYLLQLPTRRMGFTTFTLPQLKITQEVISLSVLIPLAML